MPTTFTILDIVSGQVREYKCDYTPSDVGSYYTWTEGNFSCDCNRHMSFDKEEIHFEQREGFCDGCNRFVVVKVDPMPRGYTVDEFNSGYSEEAKELSRLWEWSTKSERELLRNRAYERLAINEHGGG